LIRGVRFPVLSDDPRVGIRQDLLRSQERDQVNIWKLAETAEYIRQKKKGRPEEQPWLFAQ